MSKETKTTESTFGIVNAIVAIFELSDAGVLNKFYTKQVKRLKRNIKTFNQNIEAAKGNFDATKEELKERIEDATEYVRDAYLAVDVESIKNNAGIGEFEVKYWSTIAQKQNELEALKDEMNDLETSHADEIKTIEIDIANMKKAIDKIVKFKS